MAAVEKYEMSERNGGGICSGNAVVVMSTAKTVAVVQVVVVVAMESGLLSAVVMSTGVVSVVSVTFVHVWKSA